MPARLFKIARVAWLILLSSLGPPALAAGTGLVQDRAIESAAGAALERYSTALESLNADLVKKIQPAIDVETLKKAFREMRALEVTIADLKVLSVDSAAVRVSCKVTQTLTPKAGSKHTTTVTRVVRLKRIDASLVIDTFER